MRRIDHIIFNTLFGMVIPIAGFLLFWWGALLFTREDKNIAISALSGLILGLLIYAIIRRFWKYDVFHLYNNILISVYLFYSIGMFGFFMGVPVFQLVLGVIAGYYQAKRLIYRSGWRDYEAEISRTSRFTASVMGGVCLLSAGFALLSQSTPNDLKSMLHLPFDVTQPILIGLISVGGISLILLQYVLTRIIMKKVFLKSR